MYVHTVGDVAQCNRQFIFLHRQDSEDLERVKATDDRLRLILEEGKKSAAFFERMYREVKNLHNLRNREAEQKYQYITDEQIAEARAKDEMEGWMLGLRKDSNNVEYVREHARVSGIFDVASYAMEREREAVRLAHQAEGALRSV